jgi:hypothetical protein
MQRRVAFIALVVALCVPLLSAGSASATSARPVAQTVDATQVCAVVRNPALATAATLLGKLLPARFQPSTTLKIVIGAVAGVCPQLAALAVKVHQAYVDLVAPAHSRASVNESWISLMATTDLNVSTGEASAFVSWSGSDVAGYQEQTRAGNGWDNPTDVGGQSPSA